MYEPVATGFEGLIARGTAGSACDCRRSSVLWCRFRVCPPHGRASRRTLPGSSL